MTGIHHRKFVAMCGFALASALVTSACTSMSPDGNEPAETASPGEHTGQTTQALTGLHKVCSAITPDNWRDSIEVDDGWSGTTCHGWAASISASQWQLGCLSTSGFSWGYVNGGIPSSNCGW
jgi:hypothetical protein